MNDNAAIKRLDKEVTDFMQKSESVEHDELLSFANHIATIARNEALEDAAKMLMDSDEFLCDRHARLIRELNDRELK